MTMSLLNEEDLKRIKAQVLRSKYILDERDCDEIKSKSSREASTEVFIDILSRKGPRGYDEFCSAILHDRTQTFLLTAMNKTLEVMKAKVLELKRTLSSDTEHPSAYSTFQLDVTASLPHIHYSGYSACDHFVEDFNPRLATNRPFVQMYTRSVTSDADSDLPCGQSLPLRFSCSATP